MASKPHPMSILARYIALGLMGFACLAFLRWRGGDRFWGEPGVYAMGAISLGSFLYGAWLWRRNR